MSNRVRLAYNFWTDRNPIVSVTSESGNMKAANLQDVRLYQPWRSAVYPSGIPNQEIIFNYGEQQPVSFWLLANHNFSYAATIRRILSLDAGFTNIVFDQTYDAVDPLYGLGEGPLGLFGLGGYSDEGLIIPVVTHSHDMVVAQYEKVIISDSTNLDHYVQVGRYVSGEYWSPESSDANFGFNLKWVPSNNRSKIGRRRDVFVSVHPGLGTSNERLFNILGFLEEDSGTTRNDVLFRSHSLSIRENLTFDLNREVSFSFENLTALDEMQLNEFITIAGKL